MKKIHILFSVLILFSGGLKAQQKPQFSQYMINNYLLNPAVTGIEDYTNIKLGFRQQWVGLEGAPQSYYITGHGAIGKAPKQVLRSRKRRKTFIPYSKMGRTSGGTQLRMDKPHQGVGGAILFDKTGPIKTTCLNGSYAVHVPITRKIKASLGLSSGVLIFQYNPAEIQTAVANDPTLNTPLVKKALFDLTLGTWVYSDKFFVGASLPQLIRNRKDLTNLTNFDGSFALQQHYYLTGGYKLPLSDNFAVIPSVMIKFAKPSPVSIDLNARLLYKDFIWAGTSYRYQDAAIFMVGFNFDHILEAGYSYDATGSELNKVSAGTHEIMVGFKLFNPNKVVCPLWMW